MLPFSVFAAGVAGDIPRMRRLVEVARNMPINGRLGETVRSAGEGLLLVADGQVAEGMPSVREALKLADSMSAQLHYGMIALAILHFLGPQSPEARAAGEHALANFESGKNHAMAGHLRDALDASSLSAASPAAAEAVRVSA